MNTRHRLAAGAAAGALLLTGTAATVPASASAPSGVTAEQQGISLVVNARTGIHPSFDRFVVDVKGPLPPISVKRVKALHYDGSGAKVPLPGKYFLEIKLSPAAAHNEAGKPVYKGPRLVEPNMPKIKGVALTGDFEGVVTFGLAFKDRPGYSTMKLHKPERFVLDIRR
ncbi:hypothetical protein ABZW18_09265 [Streptomyces sp. NPDC004647]|uniref:AMIN-like domain-containing (lipo)protein n=1 Tax=Streptomyces sp. NPDC004647 TaxID=3154671 RepID=UPI0033B2655F